LLLLLVSGGERAAACCFAVLAATRGTLLTLWGWVTAGPRRLCGLRAARRSC